MVIEKRAARDEEPNAMRASGGAAREGRASRERAGPRPTWLWWEARETAYALGGGHGGRCHAWGRCRISQRWQVQGRARNSGGAEDRCARYR
jgi:hypothetical protein